MHVQVKFCGLTRAQDVNTAVTLGADYAGVIFAGGPRNQTMREASHILRGAGQLKRVGVFGAPHAVELNRYVESVPLAVAQLHGDATAKAVLAARTVGVQEIWAVVPVVDGRLGAGAKELFQCADAVVLDTRGVDGLGGTGRSFDWGAVAATLEGLREGARLVLAGGLTPGNVAEAIRCLRPHVVDVSSGVESSPGVKDSMLMGRFMEAARSA